MGELPHTLQSQLEELWARREAEEKSIIDSYYEPLIEAKRQEVRDLERQHQEALENRLSRSQGVEVNGHSSSGSSRKELPESTGDNSTSDDGVPDLPTRRVMVSSVLPNLKGRDFIRRDVEAEIISKWPEAEPKTQAESKNFTARIASLLTDFVDKEQLELTKGETRFDPRVYRVKETQEEKLALGP